jgi:LPXTG-motif cell wall-anchored protein
VSGIDPATGPVAGGQQVTITGSGFTPETAVRFGEVAATDVVVDSSGTSLTATTPAASAAGDVTVTVSRPDGSSAALAYSYTAAAPVVPVPARLPAVLAATGSDAVGSLPWLGGVLLLGGLAMSVSTRRAHRRS